MRVYTSTRTESCNAQRTAAAAIGFMNVYDAKWVDGAFMVMPTSPKVLFVVDAGHRFNAEGDVLEAFASSSHGF